MQAATFAGAMAPAEFIDAPRVVREAFPAESAVRDGRAPYSLLIAAKALAESAYPEAARVVALWTPNSRSNEVHVEVWDPQNRRARVLAADRIGEAISWR